MVQGNLFCERHDPALPQPLPPRYTDEPERKEEEVAITMRLMGQDHTLAWNGNDDMVV